MSDSTRHATCLRPIQKDVPPHYTFAILSSGDFAGLMGLNDVRSEEKTAELDYWIGFPFWGRGITTSAASLVIAHAFQKLGLQAV